MQNISLYNQESHETNLFKFDFDSLGSYQQPQAPEQQNFNFHHHPPPAIQTQHQDHNYSYFSDNTPTTLKHEPMHQEAVFSSPQLKPRHVPLMQRKRFKTVVTSTFQCESAQSSPSFKSGGEDQDQDDDDDDDDESENDRDDNSEHGSGRESVGSNNKRGKYKIYTDQEKSTILNFMMKHGMQKTLEIFSNNTHKITKRKLKSWFEGQNKVKGVKGRKTNDPNRDQALYEWCLKFINEYERAPTRKEATKKALELSEDPSFQASKGWLDKFSRKYNIEFTPLKISPPKAGKKKLNGFSESDSASSVSNNDSFSMDGISPVMQTIHAAQVQQPMPVNNYNNGYQGQTFTSTMFQPEFNNAQEGKMNQFFDFGSQNNYSNSNGYDGMNYEKKEFMPSLDQFQPLNAGSGNYHNYGYQQQQQQQQQQPQQNYQQQPNQNIVYGMNPEGMYQMEHAMSNIHGLQPHSDISSFLDLGEPYKDWQMKYEYPM